MTARARDDGEGSDFSTINLEALAKLPRAKLAPTYRLQSRPGNGCAGDPPGFPTYFTRSVYTRHGNNPRKGAEEVISYEGVLYVTRASTDWRPGEGWDDVYARYEARMRSLYKPLPFDHPRVQAWIEATMTHMAHCYKDLDQVAEPFEHGKPATIIYPVPDYKLRTFRDDPRFSEDWRVKEQAAVEAFNASRRAAYARVASVDNHAGVRAIRRFYPEYTPPTG